MTDFMCKLPFQIGSERVNRLIMQAFLTIIVLVLTLLKDPSLLVGVSSMGMIAMVLSLVILFIFGLVNTSWNFKTEYLYPSGCLFTRSLSSSSFCPTRCACRSGVTRRDT